MKKFEFEIFKMACTEEKPGFNVTFSKSTKPGKYNDECYTSADFIEGLLKGNNNDYFDLDPASSFLANSLVKIANKIYTKEDNGLKRSWDKNDYVFLNPPFSNNLFVPFIRKMVEHNNGILLTFEKISVATKYLIEPNCSLIMKFRKRSTFLTPDRENCNLNYYVALYAFGKKAQQHLLRSKRFLEGYDPYIELPESEIARLIKIREDI